MVSNAGATSIKGLTHYVAPIGREHDEATVKNGIDEKRDEAEQKIVKALEV